MPKALNATFVKGARATPQANSGAKPLAVSMMQSLEKEGASLAWKLWKPHRGPHSTRTEQFTQTTHLKDSMPASACPYACCPTSISPLNFNPGLAFESPAPRQRGCVSVCPLQAKRGRLASSRGHPPPEPTHPHPPRRHRHTHPLQGPVLSDPLTTLGPALRPSQRQPTDFSQHQSPPARTSRRMNPGPLPSSATASWR